MKIVDGKDKPRKSLTMYDNARSLLFVLILWLNLGPIYTEGAIMSLETRRDPSFRQIWYHLTSPTTSGYSYHQFEDHAPSIDASSDKANIVQFSIIAPDLPVEIGATYYPLVKGIYSVTSSVSGNSRTFYVRWLIFRSTSDGNLYYRGAIQYQDSSGSWHTDYGTSTQIYPGQQYDIVLSYSVSSSASGAHPYRCVNAIFRHGTLIVKQDWSGIGKIDYINLNTDYTSGHVYFYADMGSSSLSCDLMFSQPSWHTTIIDYSGGYNYSIYPLHLTTLLNEEAGDAIVIGEDEVQELYETYGSHDVTLSDGSVTDPTTNNASPSEVSIVVTPGGSLPEPRMNMSDIFGVYTSRLWTKGTMNLDVQSDIGDKPVITAPVLTGNIGSVTLPDMFAGLQDAINKLFGAMNVCFDATKKSVTFQKDVADKFSTAVKGWSTVNYKDMSEWIEGLHTNLQDVGSKLFDELKTIASVLEVGFGDLLPRMMEYIEDRLTEDAIKQRLMLSFKEVTDFSVSLIEDVEGEESIFDYAFRLFLDKLEESLNECLSSLEASVTEDVYLTLPSGVSIRIWDYSEQEVPDLVAQLPGVTTSGVRITWGELSVDVPWEHFISGKIWSDQLFSAKKLSQQFVPNSEDWYYSRDGETHKQGVDYDPDERYSSADAVVDGISLFLLFTTLALFVKIGLGFVAPKLTKNVLKSSFAGKDNHQEILDAIEDSSTSIEDKLDAIKTVVDDIHDTIGTFIGSTISTELSNIDAKVSELISSLESLRIQIGLKLM